MDVIMPKMGESINEGTIIKWHKSVGDAVKIDEIIFEISTDKVDTEIPSPAAGVLKEIKFNEGDTVEVGTVVAVIDSNGEAIQHADVTINESPKEMKISEDQKKNTQGNFIKIEMPKMGESVMEGTIIKWYKRVGDKIGKDETLFEISTDKVDTEVPSPAEGIIAEILIGEQETVDVGTIVAKISTGNQVATQPSKKINKIDQSEEPVQMHDNFAQPKSVMRKTEKKEGLAFYSPLVLSIAQKENINLETLSSISGTGLNGRVSKKDILAYINNRGAAIAASPSQTLAAVSTERIERIPMDNIRQKIMEHMVLSRDTSVHVSELIEVDMSKIHNFLEKKKDEYLRKSNVKLTYMAFIAYACVKALKEYPLVNSSIEGKTILQKNFINLGIAVAVEPTGLIVPNIKGAEHLNIVGLAKAISDIAQRTRNKKLIPDEVTGGTFTITNFGVFGAVFGTPIINQPEVAILGVGAVTKKPVVINVDGSDVIAIKPIMALTLSHDHRLVDGMLGGLFIKHLKDTLESFNPASI
jgi:2-oxoglutarate dehydrogenase E2 component (dihydrolipoamide succinyltransferase)